MPYGSMFSVSALDENRESRSMEFLFIVNEMETRCDNLEPMVVFLEAEGRSGERAIECED
jgi:hypothetical protein